MQPSGFLVEEEIELLVSRFMSTSNEYILYQVQGVGMTGGARSIPWRRVGRVTINELDNLLEWKRGIDIETSHFSLGRFSPQGRATSRGCRAVRRR